MHTYTIRFDAADIFDAARQLREIAARLDARDVPACVSSRPVKSRAQEIAESAIRLNNDVNGNPRYYVPQYLLPELHNPFRRRACGVSIYRGRAYGAGFVFQSYNLQGDIEFCLS